MRKHEIDARNENGRKKGQVESYPEKYLGISVCPPKLSACYPSL
jgi:hypothetical protein